MGAGVTVESLHLLQPLERLVVDVLVFTVLDQVVERHAEGIGHLGGHVDGGYVLAPFILAYDIAGGATTARGGTCHATGVMIR